MKKKQGRIDTTASDFVYRELKRQILASDLAPGSLLNEQDSIRKLGYSRTPFREACMRLREEGWLLPLSRRGFLIAPIALNDVADIYDLRLILESKCVQIAAQRAEEEDIHILQETLGIEGQRHPEGIRGLIIANVQFHMHLARLSGNARIVKVLQTVFEHVQRIDSILYQYEPATPFSQHAAIIAGIRNRDPKQAAEQIQQHIEAGRDRILRVFSRHTADLKSVQLNMEPLPTYSLS